MVDHLKGVVIAPRANRTHGQAASGHVRKVIVHERMNKRLVVVHHSLVKGAATNTLHWWSGELTANYLAMQVTLGFNTEREAGVAFFVVF